MSVHASSSERYQLLGRLAVGGMSEVFFARQHARGGFARLVVVKQLLPSSGDEECRRLLDEARLAASITHENVVTIFDVGNRDGKPFVAMEYVHGVAASILLRHAGRAGTGLPAIVAARIVQDAARGLLHAHAATDSEGANLGIVHRDVAPKNILVRKDGIAKIADFGIAMARERLSQTACGAVCGTLSHMAPEQIRMQRVTPQTDQFALGIVLWELLVGRQLFKSSSRALTLKRLLLMPIPAPSSVRADVPRALDDIVMRMLARAPAQRFPSMDDVLLALERAIPTVSSDSARREVAAFVEAAAHEDLAGREREMRAMQVDETVEQTIEQTGEEPSEAPETPLWSSSRPPPSRPAAFAPVPTFVKGAPRPRATSAGLALAVGLAAVAGAVGLVEVVQLRNAAERDLAAFDAPESGDAARGGAGGGADDDARSRAWLAARRQTAPVILRAGFAAQAARAGVPPARADAVGAQLADILAAHIDLALDDVDGGVHGGGSAARAALDTRLGRALVGLPAHVAADARDGVAQLAARPTAWRSASPDAYAALAGSSASVRARAREDLAAAIAAEARRARVDAARATRITPWLERRLQARIDLLEERDVAGDAGAALALAKLDADTRAFVEAALPLAVAEPVFVLWREYWQPPARGAPVPIFGDDVTG